MIIGSLVVFVVCFEDGDSLLIVISMGIEVTDDICSIRSVFIPTTVGVSYEFSYEVSLSVSHSLILLNVDSLRSMS